jgi:hypothetical protein
MAIPPSGDVGAGCPTGGTSLALGGRGPQTRSRETNRHEDMGITSGSPRGPDPLTGAEADDTLETGVPMTRARATRISKARALAATRRRTHAPIERLATDFSDVYDRVLSEISSTARCILAASSPVLREAHASLRPTEPVGLYKLSDALMHVSTATWWGEHLVVESEHRHRVPREVNRIMCVVGPPTAVVDKMKEMFALFDFYKDCEKNAPRYGHLHLLEYIQKSCHWYFGRPINKPVWERRESHCLYAACRAAESGHLNIVRWIFHYESDEGGRAPPVLELKEFIFIFQVAWAAVKGGAMHVLEWLFDELADEDGILSDIAYYSFLRHDEDRGWCAGHYLCAAAAKRGNLEMLKWLRADVSYKVLLSDFDRDPTPRCEWNEWTCTAAAGNGHLDVLRWAFENGCPVNENVIRRARVIGREDIEQWALANNLPEPNGDDNPWMSEDEYSSDPSHAFLTPSLSDSD